MRSRRGDMRTARKSEPSSAVSSERMPKKRISARSTVKRTLKSTKSVVRLDKSTRSGNVSAKVGRLVKRHRKPKKHKVEKRAEVIKSSESESYPAEIAQDKHETPTSVMEHKRRRTNTAEYIKKRFLYDVDDETKRSKHRKPRVNRVIPVNPPAPRRPRFQTKHNWHDAPPEDGPLHLRSRRGRRVKPKHDYSPLPHESESSPPYSSQQDTSSGRVGKRRKGRRGRRPQTSQEAELHQRRSTWELPDLFNADDNDQIDDFSQQDSVVTDAHKQRFPDTTDLPNYSDVLLDGIPNRTALLGAFEEHDRRRRVLREQLRRSDQRKIRHRHLASPNVVHKGTNSFHQRALLSPGHSSDIDPHQTDIITFCADPSTEQFRRQQEFDEFEDHAEEEYLQSSGSRAPSEEPTQTPHEDLEEEELLAPELSILAGQTDNGAALSGPMSTCGSRRKSPVRPMQVLRTKSHTSTNVSSQTPMLVSNADDSQFIFPPTVATASGYNRQIPGTGEDYLPTIFQSSGLEKSPSEASISEAHFGLKAASVLRLPSSSNSGASAIAIRSIPEHTLQIPVSAESSNSPSSVLPSLLSQNSSRTASFAPRSFSSASPSTRPSTGSGKSLLSHSTSSASRRRPTILKRGAGSTSPAVLGNVFGAQRLPEVDDTVINIPVSRTIGAFTSVHALKSTTAVQVVPTTTSSTQPSTAPAKLLQLVTTSISSPQLATNLTASDKLFGRRPGGSAVLSAASIAVPTTGTTYVDVSEAHGNSAHPVNTPYRYAVLRGSADGKRYLVLGNQGLFERNNHATMNSMTVVNANNESSTENVEAIEALQSHGNLTMETSLSPGINTASNDGEDCTTETSNCIESSHTPALRTHLQPSFTFSTSIPAPSTPSVAAI